MHPERIGKFKGSKMIVEQSWNVLKHDKELVLFPIFSAIVSLIATAVLVAIGMGIYYGNIQWFVGMPKEQQQVMYYVVAFIYYFVTFFIVNFFQAGLFIIAHARLSGQNLSFGDGFGGAIKNSGKIFVWSLISATVGVILKIISDKSKVIGKIVAAILGSAWNILTYFSLPSLIIGQKSVGESFKESAMVIRKTWGESIIISLGVGFFFGLMTLAVFSIFIVIFILVPRTDVGIILLILFVLYMVFISILSSTLSSIFKLALYEYARTGTMPQGFSPELVQNAVKVK
jgi:hypothetical protein